MKKTILAILLTLNILRADTMGGEISLGIFSYTPSGEASYDLLSLGSNTSQNLEKTFGFSTEQDLFFKAYFEHPLPFIPNLKLGYTTFSSKGTRSVGMFYWGDISLYTGDINNKLSLDILDATLYYELLDNWIEADVGLTLRYISGNMNVAAALDSSLVDFSTSTPMLYGKIRTQIPSTDLSLQLEANAIAFTGVNSYDYELSARYTFYMGLGLEAGYKAFHLENDELADSLNVNIDFSGPYAAVIWDF